MTTCYFVEPLDAFSARGHRLFGDAGSYGEALMPPHPSVLTGAFKSWLLGLDADTLKVYDGLDGDPDAQVVAAVGVPTKLTRGRVSVAPGTLRLEHLSLGRRVGASVEGLHPLPADLNLSETTSAPHIPSGQSGDTLRALLPTAVPPGLRLPSRLPMVAVLRAPRGKPLRGMWLTDRGLGHYLTGRVPPRDSMVSSASLWKSELRLGIAIDASSRIAADGAIFTSENLSLAPDVGFLVGFAGDGGLLPDGGTIRLGGDARAARADRLAWDPPPPPVEAIERSGRFRLTLAAPGIFAKGWLPERVEAEGETFALKLPGFRARLACAAIGRQDLVSGWDIARWAPKPAFRAVPAGSVYWFDRAEGEIASLISWVKGGLWGDRPDAARLSEGYNRAWLSAWMTTDERNS